MADDAGGLPFPIGARVVTRRLGLPVAGKVVGYFLPGRVWLSVMLPRYAALRETFAQWEAAYPGWEAAPVVWVESPTLESELTEEERAARVECPPIPGTSTITRAFPVADLELLE